MLSIIIKNNILSKEELKDLLKRYHQDRRINKPLLLISEERINYLDIFKREFSNLNLDKDTLSNTNLLEITDIKEHFPERLNFSNKGSYGKSYLIGGSISYSGAIKIDR